MALTGTTTTGPTVPPPTTGRSVRDAVVTPATAAATVPGPDAPKGSALPTPQPIGFALHYDADTQRLILEVREPVTGYVIYQMPPKYVVKQFAASGSTTASARGARVDSAV